jgi:hypothetical protein
MQDDQTCLIVRATVGGPTCRAMMDDHRPGMSEISWVSTGLYDRQIAQNLESVTVQGLATESEIVLRSEVAT